MNKIYRWFNLFFLLIISGLTFWLFRPITYVDNFRSQIYCQNKRYTVQAGPNFVFSLDGNLDRFNDLKAKKLCAYDVIFDYNNSFSAPASKNYEYLPVFTSDSSWLQAIFLATVIFMAGYFVINNPLTLLPLILILYIFLLNPRVDRLFCQRQIMIKINDIKNSPGKGGMMFNDNEDKQLKESVKQLCHS